MKTTLSALPTTIYFLDCDYRRRPYTTAGHVRNRLAQVTYGRENAHIYKVLIGEDYDGWTDVTAEFLDENGKVIKK